MSPQSSGPAQRPVTVALCLMVLAVALGCIAAANAHAANYKMVLCAGNNGSNSFDTATNTGSPQHPTGIFDFANYCGPAPDPAGDAAFLRISEHEASGVAGEGAYGSISWTVPPWVAILAGGGYTREPSVFNDGWRGRFWAEDFAGNGPYNILMQGTGAENSGISWWPTPTFFSHLWPFSGYGYYRRFIFEMTCMRPAGCDRSNFNAVDANTMVLVLADVSPAQVNFTGTDSNFMQGSWVKGVQSVSWDSFDLGSGLRMERLRVDGADRDVIDRAGQCDIGFSQVNHEFARSFQPCPTYGPYGHAYGLDTASLADGAHSLRVCAQDYSQYQGLDQSGGESCEERTVRVDNTAPGAPSNLQVISPNPARYMDHVGAKFSLPPDHGSPIVRVHYDEIDASGKVVAPERVLSATNPTALADIQGPAKAGAYGLRVWLEDQVGYLGPPAVAVIPHDMTPPAAPQELAAAAPTTPRSADGFDLSWRNLNDAGSPIDAAHYEIRDSNGAVVVPATEVPGTDVHAIADLRTPADRGSDTLLLWLSDAEGNVGAPTSIPLSYDCVRSDAQGGTSLVAGLGVQQQLEQILQQGEGTTLEGRLRKDSGAGVPGAPLCVFGTVAGDSQREFLGIAMTAADGSFKFGVAPGPSRTFESVYRPGQRQLSAAARLFTRVVPTFEAKSKVVRKKHYARFFGQIPGPRNDNVVVVLQVKQGKGWRAFRRYLTRDGRYEVVYRFGRMASAATFPLRAQVREQSGYPYLPGNSPLLRLKVTP